MKVRDLGGRFHCWAGRGFRYTDDRAAWCEASCAGDYCWGVSDLTAWPPLIVAVETSCA